MCVCVVKSNILDKIHGRVSCVCVCVCACAFVHVCVCVCVNEGIVKLNILDRIQRVSE